MVFENYKTIADAAIKNFIWFFLFCVYSRIFSLNIEYIIKLYYYCKYIYLIFLIHILIKYD